jgi:hypothetical protein
MGTRAQRVNREGGVDNSNASRRAALTIRCSEEDAAIIRKLANRERRSISGYVLNCILNRVSTYRQLQEKRPKNSSATAGSSGEQGKASMNAVNHKVEKHGPANRLPRAA